MVAPISSCDWRIILEIRQPVFGQRERTFWVSQDQRKHFGPGSVIKWFLAVWRWSAVRKRFAVEFTGAQADALARSASDCGSGEL